MSSFTILHVSDIHFGVKDTKQEQQRITDSLIAAAHDNSNPRPDICIFSGDMTQKGSDADFVKGEEWLNRLVEKWQSCPLFVVPGNHEVQRSKAEELILRGASKSEDLFQKWKERKKTLPHLEDFFKWHSSAVSSDLPLISDWDKSKLVCSVTKNIRGGKIRLLGLNTAIFSCNDKDDGNLVADIGLINQCLQGVDHGRELVIAIGHHSLENLVDWNKKEVVTLFSQVNGVHAYLHGHLHNESAVAHSHYGQNLTTLSAGAAYQGSQYSQSFAFYQFDIQGKEITPRTFCYDRKQGLWRLNTEHSAPITSKLPNITFSPIEDNKSSVLPSFDKLTDSEIRVINEIKLSEVQHDIYMIFSSNDKEHMRYSKGLRDTKNLPDRKEIQVISFSPTGFINIANYLLKIQYHKTSSSIFDRGTPKFVKVFCTDGTEESETFKSLSKIIKNNIADIPSSKVFNEPGYFSFCLSIDFEPSKSEESTIKQSIDICVISAFEYLWKDMSSALHKDIQKGYLNPNDFPRKLKFLKRLVDSCNEYLGDIYERQLPITPQISPLENLKNRPLASSQEILPKLKGTIPFEYYNKIEFAYKTRDEAETIEGTIESKERFSVAAKEFLSVLTVAHDFINSNEESGGELKYWANMEQAYCLFKSDVDENLEQAQDIYTNILNENEKDAVALYRSGQISMKCNNFQQSIDMFKNGIDALTNEADKRIKNGHWLQDGQIERQLAVAYWLLSEECRETEDILENVHSAILYSQQALNKNKAKNERKFILNDLVYYGWLERSIRPENEKYALSDDEMNSLFDEFQAAIDIESINYYHPLDTLCRVFDLRGEKENAEKTAKRIREILSKKYGQKNILKNLKPHESFAYLYASDVLIK